jgi:hypothetical protein
VFLIGYWKFYLTTLVCTGQLDIVINWIKSYDYCMKEDRVEPNLRAWARP